MEGFETPIAIRAYTEQPDTKPLGAKPIGKELEPSPWTLVFACETTTDAVQQLRVGFFQIRNSGDLHVEGLFFDPETVSKAEERQFEYYGQKRGLAVISADEFRTNIFLKYGYRRQGTIVGFNLPFDISRIAIRHSPARTHMRGGFSFSLTNDQLGPRVRVKHLNRKAALIDFSTPGKQDTGRGMRNRGRKVPAFRGYFVDVKTIAAALLSRRFSLGSLADNLQTPTRKHKTDEHGSGRPKDLR